MYIDKRCTERQVEKVKEGLKKEMRSERKRDIGKENIVISFKFLVDASQGNPNCP